MRKCRICNKLLNNNNWSKSNQEYQSNLCMECAREKARDYYWKHRKKRLEYMRKWRENNKGLHYQLTRSWKARNLDKVRGHHRKYYHNTEKTKIKNLIKKLGNKCVSCKNEDLRVLEIHHLEERKTKSRDYMKRGYDLSKIKLLCANCHRIEHHENCKGESI